MGVIVAVLIGVAVLTGIAVMFAITDSAVSDEPVDRADPGLPDGLVRAADIPGLRFRIGLRGYRMDDVDAALTQIHETLLDSEARAAAAAPAGDPAPAPRRRRRAPAADPADVADSES